MVILKLDMRNIILVSLATKVWHYVDNCLTVDRLIIRIIKYLRACSLTKSFSASVGLFIPMVHFIWEK